MSLRVRFRRDELGAVLEQEGHTSDIGLGGAYVETDRPPPVGTWLRLTVTAPTAWDPLELRAEVRWVEDTTPERQGGFGVKFDSLGRAEASALYELLHALGFAESTA